MRNEKYNNNRMRMEEILRLLRSGATFKELGDRFGLSTQRVRQIVARVEREEKKIEKRERPINQGNSQDEYPWYDLPCSERAAD